jgi:hypothetical protein
MVRVGVDKIDCFPLPFILHPLPQWGGEAFREIFLNAKDKFLDFNEQVSNNLSKFWFLEIGICLVIGFWNLDITVLLASCDRRKDTHDIPLLQYLLLLSMDAVD